MAVKKIKNHFSTSQCSMPVKEVLYAYLHAILSRRIIALLWKGVPLYRSPNRLLGRVNINRCLCQVVKLLLISLLLSFCPPSGKLFFSITIENPFLHIRLLLYDTFLTGSIFFFPNRKSTQLYNRKKVLFVFTFIHSYDIPLRFILRTILAILFFKVGLCCITSGNLIACEYSRDILFYNYSIKPFSFFGAESFTFIATIKYCWRLLCSSDTEQCWPVFTMTGYF